MAFKKCDVDDGADDEDAADEDDDELVSRECKLTKYVGPAVGLSCTSSSASRTSHYSLCFLVVNTIVCLLKAAEC